MTAALLLAYAAVMCVAAPAVLTRAQWVLRSPMLGIAGWLACTASVVTASLAILAVPAVVPAQTWRVMCELWRTCLLALRGGHGWTGRVFAVAAAALAACLLARVLMTTWRCVPAMMRLRRRHLVAARLVGRRIASADVAVIDHPRPAAYVVGGRRRPVVVVTSGAVQRLSHAELAAVVAHERAHAAGRHHLLIAVVRVLSEAFPTSTMFRQAHTHVARLVEVRADDTAVRRHARHHLARALVTIAEGLAATSPERQATVLAAGGGDAAARLDRLLHPPPPTTPWARAIIAAAIVAVPTAPLSLLAMAHWTPALAACPFW